MTLPPNGSKTGLHDGRRGVIRGFVTGLVWGGVVGAAGLAVISQVAPLPDANVLAGQLMQLAWPEFGWYVPGEHDPHPVWPYTLG